MDGDDNFGVASEPSTASTEDWIPTAKDWELAFGVLGEQLLSHDGCVSTVALGRELKKRGIANPRPLVLALQFFDPESSRERGISAPSFKFGHLGRSFYSEDKYQIELKKQEETTAEEADEASSQASTAAPEETAVPRVNRQEEARLVTYVKSALEELYFSDVGPEDTPLCL